MVILGINTDRFNKDTIVFKMCRNIYLALLHIFSPYGYIRNYIVFPLLGTLRKFHIYPFYKKYECLDSYKNKYEGQRCFIVATGPSLRITDLEKINNELSIGVNSLYSIFTETEFRPTFYIALDTDLGGCIKHNSKIRPCEFAKEKSFFNPMMKEKFENIAYIPICYQNHWFKVFSKNFNYSKNLKFTKDIVWGVYDKYTITNVAIDLAIHLGCNEIFLLGVDCNYSGKNILWILARIIFHQMSQKRC